MHRHCHCPDRIIWGCCQTVKKISVCTRCVLQTWTNKTWWLVERGRLTACSHDVSPSYLLYVCFCEHLLDWRHCLLGRRGHKYQNPGSRNFDSRNSIRIKVSKSWLARHGRLAGALAFLIIFAWVARAIAGWHYSSNATCLMRPRLFYVLFVVSRTTITCYVLHRFWRKRVLDK